MINGGRSEFASPVSFSIRLSVYPSTRLPVYPSTRLACHGAVLGGRRSTRTTALGVVNAPGALLPGTERGTNTAVITEPGTRAPAMGLTVGGPGVPVGNATFARIGVVVPVAVKTARSVCVCVSAGTAR